MVAVRRFDRETLYGFVDPRSYLQAQSMELIKPSAELLVIPYGHVKYVSFVKEFDGAALTRTVFHSRPKFEGLWVRMSLVDGDIMEGVLPNNLLLWDATGYTFTPPEPDGNHQKVFVPKVSLRGIQVLGVVGSPLNVAVKSGRKKPQVHPDQARLF